MGGEVELSSIGSLGGRAAAVIVDHAHPEGVEEYGRVLVEFANGEQVDVKIAGAPEYGVVSATLGADRLVEGSWADLTEAFQYYGLDGEPLADWFDPTDSAPYGQPPLFQWPVAVGSTLSWIEGPDFSGESNELVGDWQLVLADTRSGAEQARAGLGLEIGAQLLYADFDGRFWVGSFEPGGVVVVDTSASQPAPVSAGCAAGTVATIDRFGTEPAPQPACATYEPNDRYPIRLCDEGPAVEAIQHALVAAGHQLEVDGYFGPVTEQEVRRFQEASGLEVDGLVGDDTWPALMAFAQPAGADVDGSGVVDPWELGATEGASPPVGGDGFEFLPVGADGVVRGMDGAVLAGVEYVDSWGIAGDGAGLGTSGLSVFRFRVNGSEQLWSTTIIFDPGSELVKDVVDLGTLAGQTVSRACTLDGVPVGQVDTIDDVAVFGVVPPGHIEPAPATRALAVSVPEGTFTELDPSRVACTP
jgi:hypothetical protein